MTARTHTRRPAAIATMKTQFRVLRAYTLRGPPTREMPVLLGWDPREHMHLLVLVV